MSGMSTRNYEREMPTIVSPAKRARFDDYQI